MVLIRHQLLAQQLVSLASVGAVLGARGTELNGSHTIQLTNLFAGALSCFDLAFSVAVFRRSRARRLAATEALVKTGMNRVVRIAALLIFGGTVHGAAQPVILSQPQDQSILEGANASFSVEASGASLLQYQWRAYLNPLQFEEIPGATNSTLLLTNLTFSSKRMAVVIHDTEGAVTSRIARIIFQLYVAQQPTNQTANEGTDCSLPGGWRRGIQ